MKTKDLGKLLILGLILTSMVSCKEEEFYEKEFIDTLSDQYERENLPDDIGETPLPLPTENPDQNAPGTPISNDTNPTVPTPSPIEPPTEPTVPTTPPVEPPTEPTGPTTPPVEPPTEPTVPTPAPVELEAVSDVFSQNENGTKLDILWVIDNSGSMADEQKALGENFDAFIKEFVNKGIDFQMAVTTTDTSRGRAGKVYRDSMDRLTSDKLKEDKNQFMKDFAYLVKVGTRGSGYEKGIQASEVFSDRFANSWMRKDAYFTIVYMSDEEDQSSKSVPAHLKQIQKWKDNNGLIKAFSIVDMVTNRRSGGISRGYERYNEITTLTGGKVASIKSDFHTTLLEMGEQIADLTEQFPLSKSPYNDANIEIYVDGNLNSSWSYDNSSNSIKFDIYSIPAAGAKIEIRYNSKK
jgi:hypothetical protein